MSDEPKVTKENYQANLAAFWAMAHLIEEAPLPDMLAAAERADSVGAILDPTLYREHGRALAEDIEMLDALRHVQVVVQRIARRKAGA